MPDRDRTLYRSTLIFLCLGPILLYAVTALALGSRAAIELGNAALMALAIGVSVAYAPIAWSALFGGGRWTEVTWGDVLGTGIFFSFAGIFLARIFSIVWRAMGQDVSWLDWWLWGLHISLNTSAALCHLVAPEAIRGAIPSREWLHIGALIAAGMAVFGLIVVLL